MYFLENSATPGVDDTDYSNSSAPLLREDICSYEDDSILISTDEFVNQASTDEQDSETTLFSTSQDPPQLYIQEVEISEISNFAQASNENQFINTHYLNVSENPIDVSDSDLPNSFNIDDSAAQEVWNFQEPSNSNNSANF